MDANVTLQRVNSGDGKIVSRAWGSNPANFQFLTAHHQVSVHNSNRYIDSLLANPRNLAFHVIAARGAEVVGLVKANVDGHRAQVGYVIEERHSRCGYNGRFGLRLRRRQPASIRRTPQEPPILLSGRIMRHVLQHDPSRLLALACTAHGGLDAWLHVDAFRGSFHRLGGPIPLLKGLGATFDAPTAFSVYPHQRKTVFHNYPSPNCETTFDAGTSPARMLVSSAFDPHAASPSYRDRFLGLAKWRRWNPTDAAYFFGYALLTYFSVPFILKDCEVLRCSNNAVTVRFPLEFESHCQIQTFWFAPNGMLTRHDYTADVLGSIFRGAHYSAEFVDVQGIKMAQSRRVVPRIGVVPLPLTVLYAALSFD